MYVHSPDKLEINLKVFSHYARRICLKNIVKDAQQI